MLRRSRLQTIVLLLALTSLALEANVSIACPTCKDSIAANDPEHEHMVKGYFYSILFMMGMPYLLLSCFGIYIWREVKKARARDAAKNQASAGPKNPLLPAAAAVPAPTDEPTPEPLRELMEV